MNVNRGDIVVVDFPFSDRTGSKMRPALVIQDDRWNTTLDDTMLAVISSSSKRKVGSPTQLMIQMGTPESLGTGLRLDSVIDCQNIVTFDRRRIVSLLGRLPTAAMLRIDQCIREAFGL